jgi:serine/threonine-protein kinase
MQRCPSAEQLQKYLVRQLNATGHAVVEGHVQECASCQAALEDLTGTPEADRWRQLREIRSSGSQAPDADFLDRLRATPPASPGCRWPPGCADGPTALAAGTPTATEATWPSVAGYEILSELGRGGMGIVYKARQIGLNRLVALKMIPAWASASDVARFRAEAEAVAHLQHPNIVHIHEVGEGDGRPYFSMEYLEGGSLARMLAHRPQPPHSAAQLVENLARAMHYAHERGILHRDLKPANILLVSGGMVSGESSTTHHSLLTTHQPKISDFGLAKRLQPEPGQTRSGVILGTPSYMAPEQAACRSKEIGPATDVYALGAILYEMLSGRPPFQGETALETVQQVQWEEAVSPRRLQPTVPRDLETICLKCLNKEPHKRFASALDLADDLGRFLSGQPIRARRTGPLERAVKWVRRRPAAATAVAAVLAVSGGGYWAARQQASRRAETARIVNPLVEEARRLQGAARAAPTHDLAARDAALKLGQRAHDAVKAGNADAETRRRVEDLLAELKNERDLAQRVAERARQDGAMAQALADIRLRLAETKEGRRDYDRVASAYATEFRGYGIDVGRLADRETAEAVRERAIRADLVAALDDWILAAKLGHLDYRRLIEVAQGADPDALRHQLREALVRDDAEALVRLAKSAEAPGWPATTLELLESGLAGLGKRAEAVALLRRARQQHPTDLWINIRLADLLLDGRASDRQEALGCCMTALTLRSKNARVWLLFTRALRPKGQEDEAIAACREALRLQKDLPEAHNSLGITLAQKGQVDKAIAELREAIRLRKDYPSARGNLGIALAQKGQVDEAIDELREAIRLCKDYPEAHVNLGNALSKKGQIGEAIACYREAIRLRPHNPNAYFNLGNAYLRLGQVDEAIASYLEALRLRPRFADVHYNLGNARLRLGQLDEAIAEYRHAIELKPGLAEAHCNLSMALKQQGRFVEALLELRRGHELGSRQPGWPYASAQWVKEAEQLAELDSKLPALRYGEYQPRDNKERLGLIRICRIRKVYLTAARLSADAFAAEPGRAEDLRAGHRYNAACFAVLAATGRGRDSARLSESERTRWRRQAVAWLRADLALWTKRLDSARSQDRTAVAQRLRQWQTDPDLKGLRDDDALKQLPADERARCQRLWADVENVLRQSAENK